MEKELQKEGKRPYFIKEGKPFLLKQSTHFSDNNIGERKKLVAEDKYGALSEKKLDKLLQRKRKKQAGKEKKKLPRSRVREER